MPRQPPSQDPGEERPYRVYRAGSSPPARSARRGRSSGLSEPEPGRGGHTDEPPPYGGTSGRGGQLDEPPPYAGTSGRGGRLDEPPPYTVHRSRPPGLLARLRGEQDTLMPPRERRRGPPLPGRRITPLRVALGLVGLVVGWLLLSFVLFMISSSSQSSSIPAAAQAELSSGGNMLTSANTILILGTDQRPKTGPGSKEPGANHSDKGSNSDTIMLWRVGGGVSRRLSIPRDTAYDIPGVGLAKINAAYSAGGPALAVKTIERFTGLQINHLVIVNLAAFPAFIDDIGGVDVRTGRICSTISGGAKHGGFSLFLAPGVHHLDGLQALTLARTRENSCNPASNDLTREGYQQRILNAVKAKLLSPTTFFHLPWAAWDAPRTLRTDMGGLTLLSLFAAAEMGGSAPVQILKPTGSEVLPNGGDALTVTRAQVRRYVNRLING